MRKNKEVEMCSIKFCSTSVRRNKSFIEVTTARFIKFYASKAGSTCFLISILISLVLSHSVFSPEL